MALTPQIDGNIISLEQTEKVLPSKTYKINNDVVSTEIEIEEGKPTVVESDEMITIDDLSYEQISLNIKGNSWQKTREGYNLIDYSKFKSNSNATFTYNNEEITVNFPSIYTAVSQRISIQNKKYLISVNETSGYSRLEISLFKDGNKIGDTQVTKTTFSINNTNGNYDEVNIGLSNGQTEGASTFTFKHLMLSEGTEIKPFEPYGAMPSPEFPSEIKNVTGSANIIIDNGLESTDENYQTQLFTFPLAEGQRMYIDSYLADDGIHHKRGQVRLPQRTSLSTATVAGVQCQYIAYPITNMKPQGNSASKDFFCDRVKFNNGKFEKYAGYIIAQIFVVLTDLEDTIENVNSVMEGAILEYPLAEEIIESYTEEQQKVYNEINDILIESSVINIFSNDEIKPFVKVIYFSADNIIFNTGEKDRIIGYADGLEAIKQAIYHILNTERYAYLIYDDNYGVEFEQYIGKDFNFIQATIEDTLREALTYDLRITDVVVNSIDKIDSNVVAINFTATTVYGDLVLGVNINV